MKFPEKTKLQEAQGKIAIAWGWEWGRDCCKWVQGSLLGGGNVLKLDCGDGFVQLYKFIKKSWLNFMVCKMQLNTTIKKQNQTTLIPFFHLPSVHL